MTIKSTRPSVKDRIKHRTPEIFVGTCAVVGAVSFYYILKDIRSTATMAGAFAAHAADESVEVIVGGEEAFVVLSKAAAKHLREVGDLSIHDGDAGRYVLSYALPK